MSRFTEGPLDASGRTQSGFTHPVTSQLMLALPSTLSRTGVHVQRSVKRRLVNIGPGPLHPVLTVFLNNVSSSTEHEQ